MTWFSHKQSIVRAGLIWVCLTSWLGPAYSQYAPKVGKQHDDFMLPRLNGTMEQRGRPVRLSQYRGQRVLLMHFASW